MMEYTLFGESHGPAVGVLLQNVPAGLPVDDELIQADLLRRRASGSLATGRHGQRQNHACTTPERGFQKQLRHN